MNKNKKDQQITINLSAINRTYLEREAARMGYIAKSGKQSIQLGPYVLDKALNDGNQMLKLDGLDDIAAELDIMRHVARDISLLNHRLKADKETIENNPNPKKSLGDMDGQYLEELKQLCKKVLEGQDKIIENMVVMNKHQEKIQEKNGVFH